MRCFSKLVVSTLALTVASGAAVTQGQILTGGLATPYKMTRTPGGNFLVAESGTGAGDGAVVLQTGFGPRFNLLSGLPSGLVPEGAALGPTAVADAHRTLYVVIGEGDVLAESDTPGQQVPNPDALTSPIYSSVIRARFTPVPDGIREGFELSAADIQALADGRTVSLDNDSGEHVDLDLLADFRDLAPDPFLSVRQSNPFAATVAGSLTAADLAELGFAGSVAAANFLARLDPDSALGRRLEERTTVYVVDAGMNTIVGVAAATGRWHVVSRIPPQPNPLFPNLGGPVMDPVPTGIFAQADGHLLVTILPGFPFPQGAAKVLRIDPATGAFTPFIEGLTAATDVLQVGDATYVLEIFGDFFQGTPGRLLRVDPGAAPVVVAGGLIGPAGLAYDPKRHQILVAESFTGLVKRVPLSH